MLKSTTGWLNSTTWRYIFTPVFLISALHYASPSPSRGLIVSGLTYLLIVIIIAVWDSRDAQQKLAEDAQRLGAVPIPKVKGRLPGNLDILFALVRGDRDDYCGEVFRRWSEEYGPTYNMNILWADQKSRKFNEMFREFLGDGIFTVDGDAWKLHRNLARPFFVKDRISDFDCFERHSSNLLRLVSDKAESKGDIDMQDLFARFSLDSTTDFLFGHSTNSLLDQYSQFSAAFKAMTHLGSTWRWFEIFENKSREPMKIINSFVDPILTRAVQERSVLLDKNVEHENFLQHLLAADLDTELVRDELLNILLAGQDTTASLLTFTIYCLTLYPYIAVKVREEIDSQLHGRPPTVEDIKELKYLRSCMNETLRLFPPVPFNIRRSIQSCALPSPLSKTKPLYMPAGRSISYSPLLIQRRHDIWGSNALQYDPNRWLVGDAKVHVTNPFAFLPFNGGPRMCIGQQMALNEVSYLTIRLLQEYTFEFAPRQGSALPPSWKASDIGRENVEKIWPVASLTLMAKNGVWVRAKRR
ncbi:cytochrome P450 monooxygenase pc-3 [Sistotremastrum niveocremeum HHB9708]|uniref:Cytochrome P450 monooxygenase pc-3 n=1 Tax=Sistotremastrum niveocremeum HHB9708 TaxID=1314777 RepID=A0A164QSH0_9AGAM|nr:cytochrome P450 monooxygenase pc-3 [Sistotremastrum niveocremeum HHB9708]